MLTLQFRCFTCSLATSHAPHVDRVAYYVFSVFIKVQKHAFMSCYSVLLTAVLWCGVQVTSWGTWSSLRRWTGSCSVTGRLADFISWTRSRPNCPSSWPPPSTSSRQPSASTIWLGWVPRRMCLTIVMIAMFTSCCHHGSEPLPEFTRLIWWM